MWLVALFRHKIVVDGFYNLLMLGFLPAEHLEHGHKIFLILLAGQFVIQLQGLLFIASRQPADNHPTTPSDNHPCDIK